MEQHENGGFVRRNAIWLVVLVALVAFGFMLFKGWDKVITDGIDGTVTITGNFSCLPLTDGSIPSGADCILGVKSKDGLYYGLDVSRIQDANSDLTAEDTIAVTGTIKPESEITGTEWEVFGLTGVIQVNTILRTR